MTVVRASELPIDRSDPGVAAIRLVNGERGAKTMTAGVATFEPGGRIPLHTHPCEETVIVIDGSATAHIKGEHFPLGQYDTTIVPGGVPHYFSNDSDCPMTIAYFYPELDAARDPYEEKQSDDRPR